MRASHSLSGHTSTGARSTTGPAAMGARAKTPMPLPGDGAAYTRGDGSKRVGAALMAWRGGRCLCLSCARAKEEKARREFGKRKEKTGGEKKKHTHKRV